jgi:hypothetical protein
MMTEAIQREAERVTSTEVRIMAQELETTLGGVYSLLAQEMQLPLLKAIEARLDEKGELPVELKKLSASSVKPVIVAGMDALGRNADLSKIIQLQQILTPQEMQFINHEEMLKRKIMFAGITNDGLVRDADEVRAEQQQQQQQQQLAELASRAAPETIKQIGNRME